jgi:hypothetical protein
MDDLMNNQYNHTFGCRDTAADSKENIHESFALHSQTLRQVPHHPAQGRRVRYLRKSKTQAETGVV